MPKSFFWKSFSFVILMAASLLAISVFLTACTPAEPEDASAAPSPAAEPAAEAAAEPEAEPIVLSLALPSDAQAGDLLLAQICCSGGSPVSVDPASGWTLILQSIGDSGVGLASFYKIVQDPLAEPAVYPFTVTAQQAGGEAQQVSGKILICRGIDPENPVFVFTSADGSGTELRAAGLDAKEPVCIVTLFGITDNTSALASTGDPEGLQTLYNELADGGFVLYASEQAFDSGVAGDRTVTAGQSGNWASQAIAFRFAPAEVTFLAGGQGSLTADRLASVSLSAIRHVAQDQIPVVNPPDGYSFAGWLPKGGEKALSPEEVSKLSLSGGAQFTAQYQRITYTVRFLLGEHGTSADKLVFSGLAYGANISVPSVTANAGWTFDGWDESPLAAVKGDAVYTARYTKADYRVEFVLGEHGTSGDTLVFSGLASGDSIAVPNVTTDEGWTFTGWDVTPVTTVSGDATYTAQYEVTTYTITFNLDGKGTSEDTLVFSGMAIGDSFTVPTVIANPGWRFNGWNAEIPDTVEGDATFTALYEIYRPK